MQRKKQIGRILVLAPFFFQLVIAGFAGFLHLADHHHAFSALGRHLEDVACSAAEPAGSTSSVRATTQSQDHSSVILGLDFGCSSRIPGPQLQSVEPAPRPRPAAPPTSSHASINPVQTPLLALAPSLPPPVNA